MWLKPNFCAFENLIFSNTRNESLESEIFVVNYPINNSISGYTLDLSQPKIPENV